MLGDDGKMRPGLKSGEADSGQVEVGGGRGRKHPFVEPLLCAWHCANRPLPPCHPGTGVPFTEGEVEAQMT